MSRETLETTESPKRILFIRPSALGDVCRSVPIVASLKRMWPDASIDWLVQSEFVHAISAHPAVSEVVPFPRTALRRWYLPKGWLNTIRFLRSLKAKRYDLVIDGQGLGRSGLFAWATRAATRIGPSTARECGGLGYTRSVQISSTHTVDQVLELVADIGVPLVKDMQLYATQEDIDWWKERREAISRGAYAVIAPTSRWQSKQWPIERFSTVASHLVDRGMQSVVLVGAPYESRQIESMVEDAHIVNLLPELTVGRLLAVIEYASIVIANDSAALHIAVGFHRPCIGLFGPTDPEKVGPYHAEEGVIAADVDVAGVQYRDNTIGDAIIRQIEVAQVVDRVDELLCEGKS